MNCNADMVRENPDYVVRITGSDTYGKSKLDYFMSVSSKYPVIATTSELLTTGADCKMTKLIVLDKMISSMTTFKQIIGRGTRLREKEGKLSFMVMDFRNITSLFADPEWDGPIEQVENFGEEKSNNNNNGKEPPSGGNERTVYYVGKEGCKVSVINEAVAVYDTNGKLLIQENIIDYTKANIINSLKNIDNSIFILVFSFTPFFF